MANPVYPNLANEVLYFQTLNMHISGKQNGLFLSCCQNQGFLLAAQKQTFEVKQMIS